MRKIGQRIWKDVKNYYIGVAVFILYSFIVHHVFRASCPFLIMTGLPCAGCGMTRAVYCILTGQFIRGINLNPAAPMWMIWGILFGIDRYVLGRNSRWIAYGLGGVCAVTLCIYGYRMYTLFPSDPPMTYYRKNLLSKYCTFYHNLLQYIWKI